MKEIRLQVNDLLNYSEAAHILKITRATVYAMIIRGELHPLDIADRHYLFKDEVERVAHKKYSGNNST